MSIVLGKTLEEGKEYKIPAHKLIMGRTFIASDTRYGKSWTCRRIVEQLVGKAGIVIIDPEGEYSSLREKYPFLIIGRDIPVQVETAEFLAETVLSEDLSVVIDLSMTDDDTAKEFVALFIMRFMTLETRLRKPYLFVVEESDEFCPERGIGKATSEKAIRNLAKKGGKRGIGLILVAHRPAWVSKGALSQCTSLKVVGRIEWESDLNVLREFLQIHQAILRRPRDRHGKVIDDGLPHIESLAPGEFFVTGDIIDLNAFVKVGDVQTTHLGATPDVIPPTPKELTAVVKKLSETLPQILEKKLKPEAQRIAELKKEAEHKYRNVFEKKLNIEKRRLEAKFQKQLIEKDEEIRTLKRKIEEIARSQDLTQFAPVSDVFQHPIVKARMTQLTQEEADILRKIETTPNMTREQLAAFLNASRDRVKRLIDNINQKFKVKVIVGYGRPLRHKSMLQRLFITDVAEREISEIEKLQNEVTALKKDNSRLRETCLRQETTLSDLREQLRALPSIEELTRLKTALRLKSSQVADLTNRLKETSKKLRYYTRRLEKIKKEVNTIELSEEAQTELEPKLVTPIPIPNSSNSPNNLVECAVDFLRNQKGIFFTSREIAFAVGFDAAETSVFEALKLNPKIEHTPERGFRYKESD